jgi:predicted transcriptional regulator
VNDSNVIELTADIVSAHVSNNPVAAADLPQLIRTVYDALAGTAEPLVTESPRAEPAVSIRASIKPDYLVCLEDGAKLKMLKRYLRTKFGLSPEQYRVKWHLPADYPMVAPNYAATRRDLAVKIGLGRKRGAAIGQALDAAASVANVPKPAARKRLGVSLGDQTPPAAVETIEG